MLKTMLVCAPYTVPINMQNPVECHSILQELEQRPSDVNPTFIRLEWDSSGPGLFDPTLSSAHGVLSPQRDDSHM